MLLDTSGLFCCHHAPELQHDKAEGFFKNAPFKLTHSYVLAEFLPLCRARGLDVPKALVFMEDLLDNPLVEVVWVHKELHRSAVAFLRNREDKSYSLCDAVSFVLMRAHNITEALTTDRHFEQEGFTRLLKP